MSARGWNARRWNELGVILVLVAALCASVGYYSIWTLLVFVLGVTVIVGARRSAPTEFEKRQ